jgi:2-oxoglutarate ferredoxin oxidoreductase subunit gamma
MTERSFIAGFGGQGIISMGQIWVYFGMKEGRDVSFFPAYGAEKRGGMARASVIVSGEPIASPLVTVADSGVAMSADSLATVEPIVRPGGKLIVNTSLVKAGASRKDIEFFGIPAGEIAEGLGDVRAANMVMLGAMAKITGALKLDGAEAVLSGFFPPSKQKIVPLNVRALLAGVEAAGR